jgi:hypothetical protein
MTNLIKLQINMDLAGRKAGDVIELKTDKHGNIRDLYWARRFEDAKLDNCVEVYEEAKTADFHTGKPKSTKKKKSETE